jgi:hypothetical protein
MILDIPPPFYASAVVPHAGEIAPKISNVALYFIVAGSTVYSVRITPDEAV